jgi:hypothetical protein
MFVGIRRVGAEARTVLRIHASAIIEGDGAEKVQSSVAPFRVAGHALAEQGKQIISAAHGRSSFTARLKTWEVGKKQGAYRSLFVGAFVGPFCDRDQGVSLF